MKKAVLLRIAEKSASRNLSTIAMHCVCETRAKSVYDGSHAKKPYIVEVFQRIDAAHFKIVGRYSRLQRRRRVASATSTGGLCDSAYHGIQRVDFRDDRRAKFIDRLGNFVSRCGPSAQHTRRIPT